VVVNNNGDAFAVLSEDGFGDFGPFLICGGDFVPFGFLEVFIPIVPSSVGRDDCSRNEVRRQVRYFRHVSSPFWF
jgi:hypothetical protein